MNDRYLYKAKKKNWRELPTEMWWVEGYLYGIWERRYILWGMTNDVPNMVEVDPSTICQCTGLKDKNGKLIWENDVVRKVDTNALGYHRERICMVSFDNSGYWKIMTTLGDGYWIGEFEKEQLEVIGNKFDNPELLEVEE